MSLIYNKHYLNSKIIKSDSPFERIYNIKELYLVPNGDNEIIINIIHDGIISTYHLLNNSILLENINYSYCAFSIKENKNNDSVNIYYSY